MPPSNENNKNTNKKTRLISLTVILLFTIIIFSNSINNEILFGWDDGEYITNDDIQKFNFREFFTTYYLGMYQPLAVLSLSVNYTLSQANPAPYHTTNLLLHLINIGLVFLLFSRFTKRIEVTIIVTLLFAIHPMHVEAVSWIATRSNGLYSVFYLASLIFYLKFLQNKTVINILLSLIFFVLSCFSKSMAVTLPVILILFDYFHKRKFDRKAIFEKIPFFVISIIFGYISINAATEYGHIKNLNVEYTIIDRVVLFICSIVFYLVKLFAPVNLSAVYAYPVKEAGLLPWQYYFGVVVFIFLVFNIAKSGKHKKDVYFGMLFFLIAILVVLPLVWSRMLMLADRYTYLPYLGIFYIIGQFYIRIMDGDHKLLRNYKIPVVIVFIAWLIFLSATSYQRNKVWKNAITMITDVIEKDRSDVDVSIGYFFRGNIRDLSRDYKGALVDFNEAIKLNPSYTMAYNNRGIIKGSMQDFEGALEDFNKAIELEPGYADAIYNRGNANYYLNRFEAACNDWQQATNLGSKQAELILNIYCK